MVEYEKPKVRYKFREKFEMSELVSKLSSYGEVEIIKDQGVRFIPRDPDWPEAYFYLDGSIDVITEEHFEDEIESFIDTVAYILGVDIE
jgi:hypothetical protein